MFAGFVRSRVKYFKLDRTKRDIVLNNFMNRLSIFGNRIEEVFYLFIIKLFQKKIIYQQATFFEKGCTMASPGVKKFYNFGNFQRCLVVVKF